MILAVDCGNTRIKWARYRPGPYPVGSDMAAARVQQGALGQTELSSLGTQLSTMPQPSRIIIANVAGAAVEQALRVLTDAWGAPVEWLMASAERAGVINRYKQPARLGADRWAALIAARHRQSGPQLVVSAGTALTVDMLDAQGVFLGGIIAPGLRLMQQSLAAGTAGLPLSPGQYAEWPRDTTEAIATGCLEAACGAIRGMMRRLPSQAQCLITGGDAATLSAQLDIAHQRADHLVLDGLALLAQSS
jgi:type III pantothenate kinase